MLLNTCFAVGTLLSGALAQTSTKCDPLKETCPKDEALGTSFFQTWNSTSPSALDSDFWEVTAGQDLISMEDPGMTFTLHKKGDLVTVQTFFYIFWGEVEIQFQAAKGAGLISTLNLLSDDLDEIDVEIRGDNETHVSTNFYGQGDRNQDNSKWISINPSPQSALHTYKVSWTADKTEWYFDNNLVRTLPGAGPKQYPQTPCLIKLGVWPAGDSDDQGTSLWAGGPTPWDGAPYSMNVKSIKITDGSTNASSYAYSTPSDGSWKSIYVQNGQSKTAENVDKPPDKTVKEHWGGLSTGAKIGIACGAIGVAVVAGLAFMVFFFKQRKAGKHQKLAEDAAWDREHTELMSYQAGVGKDEYGASSVSVQQARPQGGWR